MKHPKRHPKLKGQRLGQVVYNAIHYDDRRYCGQDDNRPADRCDEWVGQKLFYIEDEYLVKLINDYLKEQ